jgi:hypothetical protein
VVCNPSNAKEDFGERWDANPDAYSAFTEGIRRLQREWSVIVAGGRDTNKDLEPLFGEYARTASLSGPGKGYKNQPHQSLNFLCKQGVRVLAPSRPPTFLASTKGSPP